jgi:hypothetical protein
VSNCFPISPMLPSSEWQIVSSTGDLSLVIMEVSTLHLMRRSGAIFLIQLVSSSDQSSVHHWWKLDGCRGHWAMGIFCRNGPYAWWSLNRGQSRVKRMWREFKSRNSVPLFRQKACNPSCPIQMFLWQSTLSHSVLIIQLILERLSGIIKHSALYHSSGMQSSLFSVQMLSVLENGL